MKSTKALMRRALPLAAVCALLAGLLAPSASAAKLVDYIVVLRGVSAGRPGIAAADTAAQFGGRVNRVYSHALNGYAVSLPEGAAAALAARPEVALVERDAILSVADTQTNPPWGLDRIDQTTKRLSNSYTYTNTGSGVTAYILDTGIRFSHNDFGGRAVSGFDSIDGGSADDCHGHGTHVAGTVGGSTFGVAKGVSLVGVRVLNCSGTGTTSQVIAGIDFVTADHDPGEAAVANMSLSGPASTAIDLAVENSIADGVGYAVAAGNGDIFGRGIDACAISPARVTAAMTIGATDNRDGKARFSNFGNCVDWFAPGVDIPSAWFTSDTATNTISGTSMATPHTTGVAAQYLQSNPEATPAMVRDALFNLTTKGVVRRSSTTNNHLLFTNL